MSSIALPGIYCPGRLNIGPRAFRSSGQYEAAVSICLKCDTRHVSILLQSFLGKITEAVWSIHLLDWFWLYIMLKSMHTHYRRFDVLLTNMIIMQPFENNVSNLKTKRRFHREQSLREKNQNK